MTIATWLTHATARLKSAGIATARLDALVLLEDLLREDRAHLLAHPEFELTAEQLMTLDVQITRRSAHEPLAYIRGKTEFYGREFNINKNVLEPRPESETMIDMLKSLTLEKDVRIVDVGTGSGALAITAYLEVPHAHTVIAVDIDPKCLEVAKHNVAALQADITVMTSDLLASLPLTAAHTVLLCNLPYVPDNFEINPAAGREPRLAIFGGADGLDPYRRLFDQISRRTDKPRYILTESMPPQHETLQDIARAHAYKQVRREDFIQLFEVVS